MNMQDPPAAMRMAIAAALLVLAALVLPTGQAAINGAHAFDQQLSFNGLSGGGDLTLLSGSLEATMAPSSEPLLFVRMEAGAITGLTKVCWGSPIPDCRHSPSKGLTVSWTDGSSVAMKFPKPVSGTATADHALVFFLDLDQTMDFGAATVHFGPMMGASAIGGEFTFANLPPIPDTPLHDLDANNAAGLLVATDETRVTVSGAGAPATFTTAQDSLTFQGSPVIAPFAADGIVTPFAGGALAMGPADGAAATAGMEPEHVEALIAGIGEATGGDGEFRMPDLGFLSGMEASLLNGALVQVGHDAAPTGEAGLVGSAIRSLTLIRFDSLEATGGPTVAARGSGPLHIADGRVQNAPALIGFAIFQLPWWSYLLWALAIGGIVARIVLKAPKQNERWDRLKWIGWIVGPLAAILFLVLWDQEVRRILGVSLLSGVTGEAFLTVAALELLPLAFVAFAVVTPLRIVLQSASRLAKQGTFMGLAGPAATLLGFLLGATLLLSYFDLALRTVSGS